VGLASLGVGGIFGGAALAQKCDFDAACATTCANGTCMTAQCGGVTIGACGVTPTCP
jgi:hypothetical protein